MRRGGSNAYPQYMFLNRYMKNIRFFHPKNVMFGGKILNKHVFVMIKPIGYYLVALCTCKDALSVYGRRAETQFGLRIRDLLSKPLLSVTERTIGYAYMYYRIYRRSSKITYITKTCLFKYTENFTTKNEKFQKKKKKKKKKKIFFMFLIKSWIAGTR